MKLSKEKIQALIIIISTCAIIIGFTIADFLNEDRLFSETENRVLAGKPSITVENVVNGKYSKKYEDYITDQFVARDAWITLKTHMDIALRKKAINGVYLADDDYLVEQHLPDAYSPELISDRIDNLTELLKKYPETKIMLVPTADNILTDKLPSHAVYFNERAFMDTVITELSNRLGNTFNNNTSVINLFDTLSSHSNEYIYYKTDHHWTSLGAYYAYLEWTKALDIQPFNYNLQNMQTVTSDFKGTLHSKINLNTKTDEISIFSETHDNVVSVTYDNNTSNNSLYEDKYLTGKNKYGYFLDDNHALIEINTEASNDKTLFIIKDSYANSFIPLLTPHYEKIYVIDLRYYKTGLIDFMNSCNANGNMDTLILYNCIHFIEDFNY